MDDRTLIERAAMKYELNQIIHYMRDNKPHNAPVLARMYVDNLHQDWAHTKEQRRLFTPFGDSGVRYATCHGIISQDEAYASREEMFGNFSSTRATASLAMGE